MLELIICDDETVFRKDLKKTLETELDLSGISYKSKEFCCAEDMIKELCASKDGQIFFLDIEMDKLNGMDAARLIRAQNSSAVIIFITSYTDFVFQGYEVKALNYILKPYKNEKILEVLHSALKELELSDDTGLYIEQRTGGIRLPFRTIRYLFSEKHSVHVVTNTDIVTFYGKLNEVETHLPDCFVRIHNRYLINLRYLKAIEKTYAILGQDVLPVSRSCRQELSVAYARYLLN